MASRKDIQQQIKARDIKQMERAAADMDKIAKEITRRKGDKEWNSTKELHKQRYGECSRCIRDSQMGISR